MLYNKNLKTLFNIHIYLIYINISMTEYYFLDKGINIDNDILPVIKRSKLVSNYFYPNIYKIESNFNEKINHEELYNRYGTPYIACLKDDIEYNDIYYNETITEEELKKLINSISIIPIKYKVITGLLYKYLTVISADIFNSNFKVYDKYNNICIADKNVLICSLFRFKYSSIMKYLKQYDGISNFIELYNLLLMNEYFGQFNNISSIKNNIIIMINNMDETNYYTIFNNCQLNITFGFNIRKFNLSTTDKSLDLNIANILKNNNELDRDNNYLSQIFKKNNFLDASNCINNNGYKLYKIYNDPLIEIMKNEDFNTLYDKLNEKEQYYLTLNCMISKNLCHYITNNKYILSKLNITKYSNLIRYTLGYTWITYYMEESIKKTYIKSSDRFIFDIETASLLPWFPYSNINLHICPYLPILIDNEVLNSEKNLLGVEQVIISNAIDKELFRYGITKKEKFIERLNQFISGKNNINLLENIDWSNIAISGSIMACCLPNFNTIMLNQYYNNQIDFIKFIETYYKDADIDIMCSIQNIYEYIDKIYEIANTIELNIIKNYKLDNKNNIINIYSNKSVSILINRDFIKNNLKDNDVDEIIENINNQYVKKLIYHFYIEWYKNDIIKLFNTDPIKFISNKYHELYLPVDINNINIILTNPNIEKINEINNINIEEDDIDYEKEKDYEEEERIEELFKPDNEIFSVKVNYKFRISSNYLPHDIEFFQVKNDDFFSTVAKFHLPIVRSYYNGNNVFMTPSCISACMTMINIDYKYFAGSKDPIDIVNKYRMRGFGTILNENEIKKLIEYTFLVPKWKQLYGLNNNSSSISNILGTLKFNNILFKPNHNILELQIEYLNNITDYNLYHIISKIYNSTFDDITKYTTINKYGFIDPVKKWIFDAIYEII